jgi:hypothetical protein
MAASKQSPGSGQFTIKYNVLLVGFLILFILLIIVFAIDKTQHQHIEFADYISMASFGSVTIGLIYTAISFQYTYKADIEKAAKEEVRYQETLNNAIKAENIRKIKFSYDACSTWYKIDMALNVEKTKRFMQPFKNKLHDAKELETFISALDHSIDDRKSLIAVLNYFESISLLILDNMVDEETVKKNFKTAFSTYYINLKKYIEHIQTIDSGINHRVFCNFVEIAKRWQNS